MPLQLNRLQLEPELAKHARVSCSTEVLSSASPAAAIRLWQEACVDCTDEHLGCPPLRGSRGDWRMSAGGGRGGSGQITRLRVDGCLVQHLALTKGHGEVFL